eukprot:GHVO01023949.1.p1 GENE.GHVO01023949.1~~GHVO01023949.1.p1  ORF type:complete len:107 (+),score=9.69 GHVO01023949.1:237-557(+)
MPDESAEPKKCRDERKPPPSLLYLLLLLLLLIIEGAALLSTLLGTVARFHLKNGEFVLQTFRKLQCYTSETEEDSLRSVPVFGYNLKTIQEDRGSKSVCRFRIPWL